MLVKSLINHEGIFLSQEIFEKLIWMKDIQPFVFIILRQFFLDFSLLVYFLKIPWDKKVAYTFTNLIKPN